MRLWLAYAVFVFCFGLLIILAVAGCYGEQPSGPSIDVHDNAGPVSGPFVITTGSNSPAGTAPCSTAGAPQKGNGLAAPTQDCSDNTAPPVVVTP